MVSIIDEREATWLVWVLVLLLIIGGVVGCYVVVGIGGYCDINFYLNQTY